jgi:glycosyltransferase involved in cell wall biosynthesis
VVAFAGAVPHDQIPDWLAAADVAVMPYPKLSKENWLSPLKMYEYMSAGKAIVASRVGQVAQVIRHDHSGLLVEPGDPQGLACAMLRLLADENERARLGMNARRQAVERHSWSQYARTLEDIYQQVIEASKREA